MLLPGSLRTALELLKQAALFVPVDPVGDLPQVSLVKAPEGRQKEDLFLNVGSHMEQFHDLMWHGAHVSSEALKPENAGPFVSAIQEG
jgi:hypothetical protein